MPIITTFCPFTF